MSVSLSRLVLLTTVCLAADMMLGSQLVLNKYLLDEELFIEAYAVYTFISSSKWLLKTGVIIPEEAKSREAHQLAFGLRTSMWIQS